MLNILDVIVLARNEPWPEPDEDYTTSTDTIHAVWAALRHDSYNWAVIEEAGGYAFHAVIAPQEPCQHPSAIKCGNTGNFVYENFTTNSSLLKMFLFIRCRVTCRYLI